MWKLINGKYCIWSFQKIKIVGMRTREVKKMNCSANGVKKKKEKNLNNFLKQTNKNK
jgi:hypothetical protein